MGPSLLTILKDEAQDEAEMRVGWDHGQVLFRLVWARAHYARNFIRP